ncbi:hypothetical protein NSA19_01280 [Actinomyces bowdenii]|uniref:hypothetical protein n=1 Tax=Actinomyces bowdenii TaxID=131109 RepID=UPI00214C6645|nr:hypothetical protein [Actinomyces bowdenii]MCR2051508.1 hypothetical protein [Actinomyces bowdenii]
MAQRMGRRVKHLTRGHPWITGLVVVCLTLASGGAFWWWGRYHGYWEPYCLALTGQDVEPITGEVDHGTWAPANGPEWQGKQYWVCYVYGENRAAVSVEVTRQVEANMTKKTGMTALESRASIPGAVTEQVPGTHPDTQATIVHWTGNGNAGAGWFEEDSAVVIGTWLLNDDSAALELAPYLAELIKKHAPTLLSTTGYAPQPG